MAERSGVLVVDDDELVRSMLSSLLETRGHPLCVRGRRRFRSSRPRGATHFDAVLLDMYTPPTARGSPCSHRALEMDPAPAVLMMTARAEIRAAVEGIRLGASDFLREAARPRRPRDEARPRPRERAPAKEARRLRSQPRVRLAARRQLQGAPRRRHAIAGHVAATPASSALILGESGVGERGALAARIHDKSDRKSGPFVRVNLAAIADSMIEAELFGSVRGAFTDSKKDRAGHFASAEGGTILLDEVCEFKPELQPKLLRALEERRFFPVGSDRERRMNVRVLAATNRDPQTCIANGTLRADLYYRLA